jgi:hypothetical protein
VTAFLAAPEHRVVLYTGSPFPVEARPPLPRAPETWCDHRPSWGAHGLRFVEPTSEVPDDGLQPLARR